MKRFFFLVLASIIISTSVPAMASASSATSLIDSARTYMGVKYVYGGTTASGFDCSGYTQKVFRDAGISIPRTTGAQYSTGTPVSKADLQTGDLVFFNTSGKGVSHVGIYIGSNNFIHASTSQGVSIASINDPAYWGSRYIGARRVATFTTAPQVAATKAAVKPTPYPTRAEIAQVLTEELGLKADKEVSFKDVPKNHPNVQAIEAVVAEGIFSGNAEGKFNPEATLTRGQLAKVIVESFDLTGSTEISFPDIPAEHWATDYVATLYSNDITTGYLDGNFGLNDPVTLGQFEKFIERAAK